jgi:hypothetical protein
MSDLLAVQVVGDGERVELNLVIADRPRINLAAVKLSDNRQRMLEHARQLAAFLEVPLVDQVEAMAVVGPAGQTAPDTAELAPAVGVPERPAVGGDRVEPTAVDPGEHLSIRLRASLWQNMSRGICKLYGVQGRMLLKSDEKRQSLLQKLGMLYVLLIALAVAYWVGEPAGPVIAAVAVAWAVARAAGHFVSWQHRRRLARVTVELSGHPLQPGKGYDVAVGHSNPRALRRVQLALVRLELASLDGFQINRGLATVQKPVKAIRLAALRTQVGIESSRQAVPLSAWQDQSSIRMGRVEVPSAPGSVGVRSQRALWCLEVRLGGWGGWATVHPVTIRYPAAGDLPSLGKRVQRV